MALPFSFIYTFQERAIMCVKTLSCLRRLWGRFADRLCDDWWIEWILMLFVLGTMVYNHLN